MARPKKLTKSKISAVISKTKLTLKDYVTSEEEIDSILQAIEATLNSHIEQKEAPEDTAPEGLTGVIDPRNIASTGASGDKLGVLVRTKGASEKADGVRSV